MSFQWLRIEIRWTSHSNTFYAKCEGTEKAFRFSAFDKSAADGATACDGFRQITQLS
jgi:hypothetical protein